MQSHAGDRAPAARPGARIAIDARLGAYRRGGIAEHVDRLLEGLRVLAPEERVVVLAHRRAPAVAGPFETRRLWTPPHHRWEGWAMPIELLPARIDLLHCPDVVIPIAWRGPSVVTVHDVAFLARPDLLTGDARRYYGQVDRSVRQADRVIAVSHHTRVALGRHTAVDPDRVRVVPNAVHPRFLAPGEPESDRAAVARHGLREPYVLFVGTIEPRKNVPALLRAFRRLLDGGRDLRLALAGADGWLAEGCYTLADELDLAPHARFLGYVPDEDLPALYRRAAALAHPAIDEGFGLTPLEAMACGTPVVVSGEGALREVVGEAGLYADAARPEAWAAAIGRLLDDAAFADRLAEAGRTRAAAFTTARQAEATLGVYREVLSTR